MKPQQWIFSVRYGHHPKDFINRRAVVGPAGAATVEAALHLINAPEAVRVEIRGCQTVRDFIDGRLDPARSGYFAHAPSTSAEAWVIGIGSVEVLDR